MGVIVIISALIGAVILAGSFFLANGAPQEAAMAAMACAFAVIPYVIFRVRQLTAEEEQRQAFQLELLDRLDNMQLPPSN